MLSILNNLDALLITSPVNIQYVTGFVSVAPDAREAYLLLTETKSILLTNGLYTEQAKKLSRDSLFRVHRSSLEVIEITNDNPLPRQLSALSKKYKIKRLGYEETNMTVSELVNLEKEIVGVTLIPTKGKIEALRTIKSEYEIEQIRLAATLTDQCFDHIVEIIKPGVTESEIAWEIETYIRKNNGQLAFAPIVAFGAHTSQPHYQTVNNEPLTNNQIVLLDFGAKVNGYCSDMSRVVFVGKPTKEWQTTYTTVVNAQQEALLLLEKYFNNIYHHSKTNVRRSGADLDKVARSVIEKTGLPTYPHSLGHGVGLAIHETPRLTIKKDAILLPGMVVTIEPATYIEGQYGIRIEDLVLLTNKGIEILSKSNKSLTILRK